MFTPSDLSVLAYANNFTLWHYTTVDKDVFEHGYFNSAQDMLRVNDLVIINQDTDAAQPVTKFAIVTSNKEGAVKISPYI